jgi:hypothetical protein
MSNSKNSNIKNCNFNYNIGLEYINTYRICNCICIRLNKTDLQLLKEINNIIGGSTREYKSFPVDLGDDL